MKEIGGESSRASAFTLLELLIVVAIIGILGSMLIPVYAGIRARAQRVQCVANLHGLYVAADLFLQRNGSWPQIKPNNTDSNTEDFANAWVDALAPFGPTRRTWICPAVQEVLQNPDYQHTENARVDYFPMSFDDKPTTPHQWPRQPWFIESANVHGHGNLIIFTDGSVGQSDDLIPK